MFQKIREKEQLAYSPACGHRPASELPGYGTFIGTAPTEPAKVDRLVEAFTEVYDEFAAGGPTEEEMETARKQIANQLDEQMKDPNFWLGRIGTMEYRDTRLDDLMDAAEKYQQFTAAQIKETFNAYYKPENVIKVIVRPKGNVGGAIEPAGSGE